MESSKNTTHVQAEAALNWAIGGADVSADFSADYQSIMETSEVRVLAIGGDPAESNKLLIGDQYKDLGAIVQGDNAYYQRNNPGVPISYQVLFVKDNSLAKMGFTTDYTATECVEDRVGDRVTVKVIRVHVIEDCDGIEGWGDFDFRIRVFAGHLEQNGIFLTVPQVGSSIYLNNRQFSDAGDHPAYENILRDFDFNLERTADPNPVRFGVEILGSEEDYPVIGSAYNDSRMDNASNTEWHVYNEDVDVWSHPSYTSTGLGGTYPSAFQVQIGEAGCRAEVHYAVFFDGIQIKP